MKKKIVFLSILIGGILPFKVKALTGNMAIICDKTTLEVGESTNCKVVGTSDEEVSALSFLLNSNDMITIRDVVTSSDWQGDGKDKNVALYTDENKKGTFNIATFKVTASKSGVANIYTEKLLFANKDFQNVYMKDVSMDIQVNEKAQTGEDNDQNTDFSQPSTGENTGNSNGNTTNNTKVENPKTGVYTFGGVVLFSVAVLTVIVLYKKSYFFKI